MYAMLSACTFRVSFSPRPIPSTRSPPLSLLWTIFLLWRLRENIGGFHFWICLTDSKHGCVGNPLKPGFISEPCYNLIYLEIAACRITMLPQNLSQLVPNLRVLNLNYNFIEDSRPLEGLTRLRKLTIIGSRIKAAKQLVRLVRGMVDIEMLDFRYVFLLPKKPNSGGMFQRGCFHSCGRLSYALSRVGRKSGGPSCGKSYVILHHGTCKLPRGMIPPDQRMIAAMIC